MLCIKWQELIYSARNGMNAADKFEGKAETIRSNGFCKFTAAGGASPALRPKSNATSTAKAEERIPGVNKCRIAPNGVLDRLG